MGLDITAYQGITILPEHEITDDCWDYHNVLYINQDNFLPGWNHAAGLPEQKYICIEAENKFSFRAGSYTGYGDWRRWLAHVALGITPEDVWDQAFSPELAALPFSHLICFSDCEGVIGPEVSRKLALDFAQFRPHALEASKAEGDPFGHYIQVYDDFTLAFQMATLNGAVKFH